LREDEWLISAILREINQLARMSEAERKTPRKPAEVNALIAVRLEKAIY
jgi:hypothetical protein